MEKLMPEVMTMDYCEDRPSLLEYLPEQGKTGAITLREHLKVLGTYNDNVYQSNAQATLDALERDDLDQVPVEIEQEESPECVVYYLPDHTLIRVLPDYAFEIQEWEEIEDEELEGDYDA